MELQSTVGNLDSLKLAIFHFIFLREFTKRVDPDLPFYYWTTCERFRALGDELPSFNDNPADEDEEDSSSGDDDTDDSSDDEDPRNHPLRLHRLRVNRREDCSIFVPGRSFLPIRNQTTIRQRIFRPQAALPPCPMMGEENDEGI